MTCGRPGFPQLVISFRALRYLMPAIGTGLLYFAIASLPASLVVWVGSFLGFFLVKIILEGFGGERVFFSAVLPVKL